jgi:hypothetical protein
VIVQKDKHMKWVCLHQAAGRNNASLSKDKIQQVAGKNGMWLSIETLAAHPTVAPTFELTWVLPRHLACLPPCLPRQSFLMQRAKLLWIQSLAFKGPSKFKHVWPRCNSSLKHVIETSATLSRVMGLIVL